MKCDNCNKPATVHLTEIKSGKKIEKHLCEQCAAQNEGFATPAGGDPGDLVSAVAVMGGFDRKITSHAFRGGELTAFMGGGKLDLRDALPAGGQAIVNVFALMGGFEIIVPETWSVSLEVTPFMGGVEDKARTSTNPSAPRLVVRGFVMMSSVEIKNA